MNTVKPDLQQLWDTMEIDENAIPAIKIAVEKIGENRGRYQNTAYKVNEKLSWWMIGIVHYLEGGLRFTTHLFNGDPLTGRTVKHPKGYPKIGKPPFTWEESAESALRYQSWDKVPVFNMPAILHTLERYNGLGYRKQGVLSPYLWSMTNHYKKGKFVEVQENGKWKSVFQPDKESQQIGAAPLVRYLTDKTLGA